MSPAHRFNVLILCTGNSARSIMAEALINHLGAPRFRAYSAGSRPAGQVHPLALKTLEIHQVSAAGARSKSWDEFAQAGAPQMNGVITVCDNAANEACPVWPGAPVTVHWGLPDPAAAAGSETQKLKAFDEVFMRLDARVRAFTALQVEQLAPSRLAQALQRIAREF